MDADSSAYASWWASRALVNKRDERWQEVASAVVGFADHNYGRIRDAEDAWRSGQSIHMTTFGIIESPAVVYGFLGHHELLQHWSKAVSCIVDIGWDLHSWRVEPERDFYGAFAVFVRPRQAS